MSSACIVARVRAQLEREPDRPLFTFIGRGGAKLHFRAEQFRVEVATAAARMRQLGVTRGSRIIVACRCSASSSVAFIAALSLGAVPAIRPLAATLLSAKDARPDSFDDLRAILAIVRGKFVVTDDAFVDVMSTALPKSACMGMGVSAPRSTKVDANNLEDNSEHNPLPEETAFIQFSSGSTGQPKGIVISHGALLRQVEQFCRVLPFSREDTNVSALPFFHDMGLITQLFFPLLTGGCSVVLDPRYWALRPASLLRAVHDYRGTMTWMPNFAFAHCIRSVRDRDLKGLDLSSWDKLGNGSEPVDIELMRSFQRRFAAFGLRSGALRTGYGLAETVLSATVSKRGAELEEDRVRLKTRQGHVYAQPDTSSSVAFASCGTPVGGTKIEIRSSSGEVLEDRRIGEVWLSSLSMYSGYLDHRGEIESPIEGEWLQTGDIGYVADGKLFVCGRRDDRIIHCGHNIHPEAIERVIIQHAGENLAGVAVFGVELRSVGTQQIVAVLELRRRMSKDARGELTQKLQGQVKQALDANLFRLEFVSRGWIPRTTSGKIRRSEAREKLHTQHREHSHATTVDADRQSTCR